MHVSEFECAIAKSQISRYIAGDRMSDETMKQLEEHIARCSSCKNMIDQRRKELIQLLNLEEKTPGADPVKKETVKQTIARGKGLVEGALARKEEVSLKIAPPTHAVVAAEKEVEDNVLELSMALSGARKAKKTEAEAPLEVVTNEGTTTETVAPKPRRSLFKKKSNPDDSVPEAAPQQSLPEEPGNDPVILAEADAPAENTISGIEIPLFADALSNELEALKNEGPEIPAAENPLIQAFLNGENKDASPIEPTASAPQPEEPAQPAKAPRKSIFETLKLARRVPESETAIPQAISQAAKAPGGLGVYGRPILTSIALATVIGAMAFVAGNPTKLMGKKADAAGSEVFAVKDPVTNKNEEKDPKGSVWRKRRNGEKVSNDELNAALTTKTAKAVKPKASKSKTTKAKAGASNDDKVAKTTAGGAALDGASSVTGSKKVDPKKAAVLAQMKKARAARLARIKAKKAAEAKKNEVIAIKPSKKTASKAASTAKTRKATPKKRTAKKRTSTAAQQFVAPKPSSGIKVYDADGNPM